jgi:nucleotide-binding universal stress UspA family protein
MAPRTARLAAQPLWQLIERLDAEMQQVILELVGAAGAKSLRRASRWARALANGRVKRITLSVDDVHDLPLRLRERFPRLQRLELQADPDGALTETAFADFAVTELAHLPSLVELDLHGCKSLSTAAALALRDYSPQLEGLDLKDTGESRRPAPVAAFEPWPRCCCD